MVFLHAFPLNGQMWDPVRAELPVGLRTLALDFPGFGDRPAFDSDTPPGIASLADLAIGQIEALTDRPAVLVGLSLGGYVMGELVGRRPDLVAGLVFADTRLSADAPAEQPRREAMAGQVLADGHVGSLLTDYLPACMGQTTFAQRPAVVDRAKRLILQASPAGAAWTFRAMSARVDTSGAVRDSGLPGCLIVGAEDALCTADDRRLISDALRGGPVLEIPRAGHYSAMEDPHGFASRLVLFLQNTYATGVRTHG
ncbi:alpha/beta hydrolase [Saxibacter everestensis]|uniref:Alpha/beta hydrolase n=1 Tax=Saxibacter everestensis TaxID=2909229 RepID=A0ABY8QRM0_9MICO|nr:alpha/beta hydrolase [Brevibacteriaceae bacterium ZFBP1038]